MAMRQIGHKITVAARSPIAAWAARRGMIDESISLERFSPLLWGINSLPDGRGSDVWSLFENFNQIISFLGGPNESVAKRLTELCGPDRIIHIDPRPSEKTIGECVHITKQWAEEIKRQGVGFQYEVSDLRLKIPNVQRQAAQPKKHKESSTPPHHHISTSPHVIVHPGSGGLAKCCPLESMEALVRELLVRGWHARWMIGPDEMERDGTDFQRRLERTAPVIFEESVEAAADLVAAADVFIGNDAGMTHVAALAGVNTVALFGPTNPRVWRPPGLNCAAFRFPSPQEPEENWAGSLVRMIAGNQ